MGKLYELGIGVARNFEEAANWYRKAAQHKLAEGEYQLGHMYSQGLGVGQDRNIALDWYKKAEEKFMQLAKKGNAQDEYRLSLFYLATKFELEKQDEAILWLEKAAAQEHIEALSTLGQRYARAKDYNKALDCWHKAASKGDGESEFQIGLAYKWGYGVPIDLTEAAKWFEKAAGHGVSDAQLHLGMMYKAGQGVPKDVNKARNWLSKAAQQGNEEAQDELELIGK